MVRMILTDSQWNKLQKALKFAKCRVSKSTRLTLEGIFWYLRTGSPWRDLPSEFGKWQTVYSRFNEWSESGKFLKVFNEIKSDVDFEWVSIDATCIKVHQHACGGGKDALCIGSSSGGKNTKLHAATDALGNPIELVIGPGNEHDSQKAAQLFQSVYHAEAILADKAYDSDELRKQAEEQHSYAVIPLKKTENKDLNSISSSTKPDIRLKIFFRKSKALGV
tara:strand:+ start:74 stop:736 length:663 start_codon:yes stop_codon:yes gene_type:complete